MNDTIRHWRTAGLLAVGLGLAACGGKGTPPRSAATLTPPPTSPGEVDAVMALLDQGEAKAARKRIAAALKRDPTNPSLQVLRDSLDRDPAELLGQTSYAYTVRPGDTMTGLAQRFLGNRLKAYQLARYNAVDKPAALAPGRMLRIPGTAPVTQPRRSEEIRRAERKASKPAIAAPRPKPRAPRPAAVAATPRAADPGAGRAKREAGVARAAGLAALNQGQVGRAVGLLRRAASLDPANPVNGRDLARAERIASAVRARR